MKKIFFSVIFLLVISEILTAQDYNWITPNKTYLKMYVADNGMYRVNRIDFTNAGINTTGIDPRTIKLYNKGIQLPVYFSGQQDGTFDANDYFDFYGERNYGGLVKSFDHNNNLVYTTDEYHNEYSDTNVYWADWGGALGARYSDMNYPVVTPYSGSSFNDKIVFDKNNFYSQGENISATDYRFLNTEKFQGEGWFWTTLNNNQTLTETFSLPYLSPVVSNASIYIFAYPRVRNTSVLNEHNLEVKVNGNLVAYISKNDFLRFDSTITFTSSFLVTGTNTVTIKYIPATGTTGGVHFDNFKIQYPRRFAFENSVMSGNLSSSADTTTKFFRLSGYNSGNPVNIYDVNNFKRITGSSFTLDTLKFSGKSNSNFQIVNSNITKKPFRIKQKQVPNLVSASNGADYLIIYNKLFISQAEQLKNYRSTKDGYRSLKVDIEDIYDIFNYGLENPAAGRTFVKYVYDNWQLPKLGYVCLFGRGSLDPKKNLASSTYSNNLVPVYGNPPSDGYYTNFNMGTFCYYPMVSVGRLPAYSEIEAQNMVDKIIGYENEPPAFWSKNFAFITGGGTTAEQNGHISKSNYDIGVFIDIAPIFGNPIKIYRNDIPGNITFNIKDSVKNVFDRGTMFMNFRGHAGSHDWEIAMNDPNTLSNGNKLPVVLSLTCFTGENSKSDYRGFSERFLYLKDKGAIGFIGTTGWSYSQFGNDFGSHILASMKNDSTRRIGDLMKYANKQMSKDSLSFSIRHTLNCYSLIGDPAAKLNLPRTPEYSVTNSDYKLSNEFPGVGENITLTAYPKNYGLNSDSLKIRFQVFRNSQVYYTKDTIRRNFRNLDSVAYTFKADSSGIYNMTVNLDQDNWNPNEVKTNNTLNVDIPVKNIAFMPLKPVNNSIVTTDSVEFTCLNPLILTSINSVKVILQMDTSRNFNSPLLKTFANTNISGAATKFKTSVSIPVSNRIHYWRTNSVINSDSTGWSGTQNFVYQNLNTLRGTNIETQRAGSGNSVQLLKKFSTQHLSSDLNSLIYKDDGLQISDYSSQLYVRSYGSNGEEASYFSVGNKNIYIDAGINQGLNILKVKKLNGKILDYKVLKMNSGTSNDSLVTFLNTFDTTQYLMLLTAAYVPGGQLLSAAAKTKLKEFGSIYCDSIGFLSYFHSWSFIGYKGATHSQVSEAFDPCCRVSITCLDCDHWSEAVSTKNVTFKYSEGTASNIVGPAQSWDSFSWEQILFPGSTISFDVYGLTDNNSQILLFSNVTTNTFTNLNSIDAHTYPRLNLITKISIDTLTGYKSSVMNSLQVNYTPPSEPVWDVNSLFINSENKTGQYLKVSANCFNHGYLNLNGMTVDFYKNSVTPANLIASDSNNFVIAVDNFKTYQYKLKIPPFRDSIGIFMKVRPKGGNNEFFTFNNTAYIEIKDQYQYRPGNVTVYVDGVTVNNGDYVRQNPEIKIEFNDEENSGAFNADASQLSMKINGNVFTNSQKGISGKLTRSLDKGIDNQSNSSDRSFTFYPELKGGLNRLSVFYDNNGLSDSIFYDVIVSEDLIVDNIYNYPNPMRSETNFMFNVGGLTPPDRFQIKIYTASGKLIKELDYPVSIGFNQIPWDGKDQDGDIVANGTYLYKLVMEGNSRDESQVFKLAVLK
ncbi:MAG: hypothetical protein IPM38_16810 [Ignavibacteria bacterium]|nr:hypothetical protein [Ignavibacteria bacterium]